AAACRQDRPAPSRTTAIAAARQAFALSIIDSQLSGRRRATVRQAPRPVKRASAAARTWRATFPAPCRYARLATEPSPLQRTTMRMRGRCRTMQPTLCMGGPMRSASLGLAAALCLSFGALTPAAPPPLPAEHLTVERLPPKSPHWVYVFDEAFDNEIDARVHLFDGDSFRRLGQIDAGFPPSVNLSPDGATTVVATTYFA